MTFFSVSGGRQVLDGRHGALHAVFLHPPALHDLLPRQGGLARRPHGGVERGRY